MELNSNVGFLNVRPPRLEDAGLEDTALPTHAIQEAFKRAADALQTAPWHVQASTTVSNLGGVRADEEECAKSRGRGEDVQQEYFLHRNVSAALGEEESCVDTKAGGLVEEGHDLVVGQDVGLYGSDKVEFGKEGGVPKLGDKGCVEGLTGDRGEDKDTTDEAEDGPILVVA
ncbi:unnamed protein product [Calypogeia fissa]